MSEENHLPISGGKAVVECLKAHNIKYVFGLIGSALSSLDLRVLVNLPWANY